MRHDGSIEPTAGNTPVSTQLCQAKNGSTEPIAGNYTHELSTLSSQNGYNTATNGSEFPLGVPGNPTLIILVPMFLPYVFCYSSTKKKCWQGIKSATLDSCWSGKNSSRFIFYIIHRKVGLTSNVKLIYVDRASSFLDQLLPIFNLEICNMEI